MERPNRRVWCTGCREGVTYGIVVSARDLDLSINTVKTHAKNLFRKLGVRNRTEASLWDAVG